MLEWYTVYGVANEPALGEMLLLINLGTILYGRAMQKFEIFQIKINNFIFLLFEL